MHVPDRIWVPTAVIANTYNASQNHVRPKRSCCKTAVLHKTSEYSSVRTVCGCIYI